MSFSAEGCTPIEIKLPGAQTVERALSDVSITMDDLGCNSIFDNPPRQRSLFAYTEETAAGVAQIPWIALERLGKVFKEGELKYVRDNWKMGVGDSVFQEKRGEHAFRHLMLYLQGDRAEDHLAKVMWYAAIQMWIECNEEVPF